MGPAIPYPGLRAFTRDEAHLFFGRDNCVAEMIDKLAAHRWLAVLGSSGSGKSSLVRTGMLEYLPSLYPGQSQWKVIDFHPAGSPTESLARGLFAQQADEVAEEDFELLAHSLTRGPRAIIEWCQAGHLPEDHNLLLLVDQFEELFRFSSYADREEAESFVRLLLESSQSEEFPISVCLTMRTEFLSDCAMIPGLAERINDGLFLTPRMTRDECEEAIVGPASISPLYDFDQARGFEVEPVLVNQLLNDMATLAPWEAKDDAAQALARRSDQLPLMQHVLNHLWLESSGSERSADTDLVLKRSDYQRLGGLTGALDAHGMKVLTELDAVPPAENAPVNAKVAHNDNRKGWTRYEQVSRLFRALVAGPSLAKAVRRPCRFDELGSVVGDAKAAREIVDAFRAHGVNFLRPYEGEPIEDSTVIDISHESLIRQWGLLTNWFEEEREAGLAWHQLSLQQESFAQGRADLLSGLTLANFSEFWTKEQPTAVWAERHGGNFGAIEKFYHESVTQDEYERAEEERKQQRETNRLRGFLAGAVVLAAIATAGGIYGQNEATKAKKAELDAERALAIAEDANEKQKKAISGQQIAVIKANRSASDANDSAQEALKAQEEAKRQEELALQSAAQERIAAEQAAESARVAEASRRAAEENLKRAQIAERQADDIITDVTAALTDEDAANDVYGSRLRRGVREVISESGSGSDK